jgi:hypothetical protein
VGSTDPDALLALINENISVLDNFNVQYLTGTAAGTGAGAAVEESDASDVDVALLRGGYNEYMSR